MAGLFTLWIDIEKRARRWTQYKCSSAVRVIRVARASVQRFSTAGPRGRAREWATLGVHPLSWLLSNNRLEEVCGTLTKGTFSSRLLLSNQDKGCTPSVARSLPLPLPLGFCSTCQSCMRAWVGLLLLGNNEKPHNSRLFSDDQSISLFVLILMHFHTDSEYSNKNLIFFFWQKLEIFDLTSTLDTHVETVDIMFWKILSTHINIEQH